MAECGVEVPASSSAFAGLAGVEPPFSPVGFGWCRVNTVYKFSILLSCRRVQTFVGFFFFFFFLFFLFFNE